MAVIETVAGHAVGQVVSKMLEAPIRRASEALDTFWGGAERLRRLRQSVSPNGRGVWLSRDAEPPQEYEHPGNWRIPIITIANLKGGVGKTTIAANLAASFCRRYDKRVLLIDLDFQGSLSSMAFPNAAAVPHPGEISEASKLLSGRDVELRQVHQCIPLTAPNQLFAVPAYYDLARTENQMMVEWLIGDLKNDLRYFLFSRLRDPRMQRFDAIIIDAPPRLTTGCVQALCASSAVLIPTVPDTLSSEAVGTFIRQLHDHREIWPNLRIAGVIGNLGSKNTTAQQQDALDRLERVLGELQVAPSVLWRDSLLPKLKPLSDAAGYRIAYLHGNAQEDRDLRGYFDYYAQRLMH